MRPGQSPFQNWIIIQHVSRDFFDRSAISSAHGKHNCGCLNILGRRSKRANFQPVVSNGCFGFCQACPNKRLGGDFWRRRRGGGQFEANLRILGLILAVRFQSSSSARSGASLWPACFGSPTGDDWLFSGATPYTCSATSRRLARPLPIWSQPNRVYLPIAEMPSESLWVGVEGSVAPSCSNGIFLRQTKEQRPLREGDYRFGVEQQLYLHFQGPFSEPEPTRKLGSSCELRARKSGRCVFVPTTHIFSRSSPPICSRRCS